MFIGKFNNLKYKSSSSNNLFLRPSTTTKIMVLFGMKISDFFNPSLKNYLTDIATALRSTGVEYNISVLFIY